MKITKFRFEDKAAEWRLEELAFNKLTLLVGASGVGKTQILRALMNLKEIAEGKSFNGVAWFVEFETIDNQNDTIKYVWEGEFEKSANIAFFFDSNTQNHIIIKEKLTINGKIIVDRNHKELIYKDKKTPKLPPNQSVIFLLRNEEVISIVLKNLKKIKYISYSGFSDLKPDFLLQQIMKIIPAFANASLLERELKTLADIQNSDSDITINYSSARC